jgi:phage-related minor tail protein
MSKVTGESVEKSAAKILELADKPAQTIAKLNEQYHFLTASQYAQIAALEAEGKVREASRLANQLDAQAMKARAQDVQDNAGWMVRAGHSVAEAWGKAWDAMKGVGRKEDLGQIASALEDQIKELSGVHFVGSVAMPGLNSDDPRLAKLRTQLAAIRHEQTVAAFKANADYLEAAKNADAIAAQQAGAAFDSPDIKRKNEIAKANKTLVDSLAGAVTEEQRAQYRTRYANQVTAANQAYESAVKQGRPSASGGGGGSKADPFASLNSLVQGA